MVSGTALADQFDAQIAGLRQQAAAQADSAAQLHSVASGYQEQVQKLNLQIAQIRTQIALNNAKSAKLSDQIAQAQAQLASKKAVLSEEIKTIYLQSGVTPLEMLASSKNISEYLDAQQYSDKVKTSIENDMAAILALKTQLDSQQTEVKQLLAAQEGQRAQLAQAQAEASALLATAQQSATTADAQVQSSNSQISTLKAQQAAAIAAASRHISGGGSGGSGCGGYPAIWCNSAQDSITDSWGMYNRECVSYTAWATAVRFGRYMPYWGGRGNAKQWPGNAQSDGIPVDHSPRVGDVAIYMGGTYGHAMIVESINGSKVTVSSFNSDNTGHFSIDEWSISNLVFIHFR
jgi:surface antigen